jgi:hypothetical protein
MQKTGDVAFRNWMFPDLWSSEIRVIRAKSCPANPSFFALKLQVVAARVQIKSLAVSYPGVGRFRRAETGILGRAIKGVPLGLPFLFVHRCTRPTRARGQSRSCRPKEPGTRRRYGMARPPRFISEACRDLAFATFRRNTDGPNSFARAGHSLL